jgi:DNA-binding PadR family transcriptional regulator
LKLFFGHRNRGRHGSHGGIGHALRHGFGGEGRSGRGGSRKRLFDGAALKLILLRLIEQEPRHGYDLIREIEELSGGVYVPSPGVIYPTLTMLADMGLIAEAESDRSRKSFAITAEGSAQLAGEHDAVEALLARLTTLAADEGGANHTPVLRALDNLQNVLRNRLSQKETALSTIHDAAALIDDAAQQIERL